MPDLLERLKSALADRYAVESEIGRGGMATVFLAEDLKHHRQVAVKVLHPELAAAGAHSALYGQPRSVPRLDAAFFATTASSPDLRPSSFPRESASRDPIHQRSRCG